MILYEFHIAENHHSGIPIILDAVRQHGLPSPVFESAKGTFKVTLYNETENEQTFSKEEEELLSFCKTPRTREDLKEHFKNQLTINYLMSKIVHPLINQGMIKLTLPHKPKSKNQKYYSV